MDKLLGEIPSDADQYYIHDLAILPEFRGHGFAQEGVRLLCDVGKGFETMGLVSVYGTGAFWVRFGFVEGEGDEGLRSKLREYGDDAVFLERWNGGDSG